MIVVYYDYEEIVELFIIVGICNLVYVVCYNLMLSCIFF